MVKKVGFIGEGDSEVIILNSSNFQELLKRFSLDCVGVFNAEGIGNLMKKNERIASYFKIFQDRNADIILVLGDLDFERCIVEKKNSFYKFAENQTVIICVKAIEAWYLADSITLSSIFKRNYFYPEPENTSELPFEVLKKEFVSKLDRGIGSKVLLSKSMIRNGFSIENAIQHPNCKSVNYFFNKLTTN